MSDRTNRSVPDANGVARRDNARMVGRIGCLPAIVVLAAAVTQARPAALQTPTAESRGAVRWVARVTDLVRGVRPGDRVNEPLPQTKYDPTFDRDTSFFEDAVTFVLPLRVDAAAKPGTQSASIVVSYQVCDSRICLPPARVTVSVPLTIKGA